MDISNKTEVIIYKTPEGNLSIDVNYGNDTFWLTQKAIAQLFGVEVPAVNKHLNNIYQSSELKKDATISILETVQIEGKRKVKRKVEYYNLDAIIAVGYRVNSYNATQFRIWATNVLKEYLLKGYSINNRMNRIEDNVDENTISILSKKEKDVKVLLLTKSISRAVELDIERVNEQYNNFEIKEFRKSHDRFLIIDNTEIYHIGASLKDLDKKWFAFSKMDKDSVESILTSIGDRA